MTVYATGTSGTIGRHFPRTVAPLDFRRFIDNDDVIPKRFKSGDTVIHAAGIVGANKVDFDVESSWQVNVEETLKFGRNCKVAGVSKFAFISSGHVYGNSLKKMTEIDAPDPLSQYATQKLIAEQGLESIFESEPERLLILRVFSILGKQVLDFTLGGAIKRIMSGAMSSIANSDDVRDFLSPQQAARFSYDLALVENASGRVNVGSGEALSIKTASELLAHALGGQLPEASFESGNSAMPHLVSDNRKMLHFLGLQGVQFKAE